MYRATTQPGAEGVTSGRAEVTGLPAAPMWQAAEKAADRHSPAGTGSTPAGSTAGWDELCSTAHTNGNIRRR